MTTERLITKAIGLGRDALAVNGPKLPFRGLPLTQIFATDGEGFKYLACSQLCPVLAKQYSRNGSMASNQILPGWVARGSAKRICAAYSPFRL